MHDKFSFKAKFLEIDCDEIPVPFAVLQGYWVVQNLHFVMIFARVVQIAIVATGFYMYYCRWQVRIYNLRFSVFTSVQVRFSFFFWLFLLRMRGNLQIYRKISISRLLWGDRWKLHGEIQKYGWTRLSYILINILKGIRCRIRLIAPNAEAIFWQMFCIWHSQFIFWSMCTRRDFVDDTCFTGWGSKSWAHLAFWDRPLWSRARKQVFNF